MAGLHSLSLSPHCFLFTEGRDGEVRGGARRRLGRLLLSPVRLRQQQQEPRQPRHLPHTDPPAERKHQSGESLSISLPLSLSVSLPLSLQLSPLLMKIVMRSIHIILPVSFLPPGLASPVSLHAGIPSI